MKLVLTVVLVLHGLIHLMGFAKAFGFAQLEALRAPISRPMGAVWLGASLLLLAAAAALFAAPRWWWLVLGAAVLLSQAAIITSWSDAKFGTIANVVALLVAVLGFFRTGPTSLRADYEAAVERGAARLSPQPPVTEAELAALPPPVARYLRVTGVVGRPRVQHLRARWTGRIRSGPDSPWMALEAEQHNFFDRPTRLFFMTAVRGGVPAVGLHAYEDQAASMRVKLLSVLPLVEAHGEAFTRAETVTVFNDMCLLAPASLLSPSITWEQASPTEVKARFTDGAHTIAATLVFDPTSGALVDFFSDDRPRLAEDNVSFERLRWSTPVTRWGTFAGLRLAATAEAKYHAPAGPFSYAEFELNELSYDDR